MKLNWIEYGRGLWLAGVSREELVAIVSKLSKTAAIDVYSGYIACRLAEKLEAAK